MRDKSQVVLPLNLGICIPEGDFVFKVAEICEELDYTELFNTYVRKWRKVNPVTLFEILVFGYMEHLYSGRDIELLEGFLSKKSEYLSHLGKFNGRNSFSKSDAEATFLICVILTK